MVVSLCGFDKQAVLWGCGGGGVDLINRLWLWRCGYGDLINRL